MANTWSLPFYEAKNALLRCPLWQQAHQIGGLNLYFGLQNDRADVFIIPINFYHQLLLDIRLHFLDNASLPHHCWFDYYIDVLRP